MLALGLLGPVLAAGPVRAQDGGGPGFRSRMLLKNVSIGYGPLVRFWLWAGADPDARERSSGRSPLTMASTVGDEDVVRVLLGAGADPNALDGRGERPLAVAIDWGEARIARTLLEGGADPNLPDGRGGLRPLDEACISGDKGVVEALLAHGAGSAEGDAWSLAECVEGGRVGAPPPPDQSGAAPEGPAGFLDRRLLLNVMEGDRLWAQAALLAGADPDVRDGDGVRALEFAMWGGNEGIVRDLLSRGADPDAPTRDGTPPLHFAAGEGLWDAVGSLLDHGARPDGDGSFAGRAATPLIKAVVAGNVWAVERLLAAGADPGREDALGRTPLAWAVGRRLPGAVRALLGHGADPDRIGSDGVLPLVAAAEAGERASVEALLARGASPDARDARGLSAMFWAVFLHRGGIRRELLQAGADPFPVCYGRDPRKDAADCPFRVRFSDETGVFALEENPDFVPPLEFSEETGRRGPREGADVIRRPTDGP